MSNEVFEGIGVINEKSEAMSKNGEYWKYLITLNGKENPNTFNFFDYEAGSKVKVGDEVKLFWVENQGNYKGEIVIYKNIKSIFPYDPRAEKSDEELAIEEKEVYDASHSTVIAKESNGSGGGSSLKKTVSDYNKEKQLEMFRFSCFNASAAVHSGMQGGVTVQDIFDFAEMLFREAEKRDYLKLKK